MTDKTGLQRRRNFSKINFKRGGIAGLLALAVPFSRWSPRRRVAAAGGIGWGGDSKAPNPTFNADVTVDEWNGADFDEALQYYDDSGDAAQLPASVNASNDNPITLTATDIAFEQNDEFRERAMRTARIPPRRSMRTSGRRAAPRWIDDDRAGRRRAELRGGRRRVTRRRTRTSPSRTVRKGYLTIAADINSASGTPTLQVTDGDGDYVEVTLYDATGDASNDTLLANSTGEGMVLQQQVGDLTVQGGGDGTFDSTEEITVSRRHRRGRVGSRRRAHARSGVRRAARRERRRRRSSKPVTITEPQGNVLGREHGRAR